MYKKFLAIATITAILPLASLCASECGKCEDSCNLKTRCCKPCRELFTPCKRSCCRPCRELFTPCNRCCKSCKVKKEVKEEKKGPRVSPLCGRPACDHLFESCPKKCCRPCNELFKPCKRTCCRPACDHLFEPCRRACVSEE